MIPDARFKIPGLLGRFVSFRLSNRVHAAAVAVRPSVLPITYMFTRVPS